MTFPPPLPVDGYISLPVTVDPNVLIAQAFAAIQAQYPGWIPKEGQLDVAIIEEAAQMVAVSNAVAAQMSITIFETFGGLVGILPILGAPATAVGLFTMTDDAGYTIPAGTVVAYPVSGSSQILFTVQTTVTISEGSTTGTCVLVCETVGVFANGLAAATCQMVTTFAQVETIATTATSQGGVDPDTQTSYINRLSTELQLLAPRPIVPSDFAAMAQNVTGVFRALAIDGLNPGRSVTDGVTNSTTTLTSATADFVPADVGRPVVGGTFPAATVIQTFVSATDVTTNHAATGSATGVHLTFGDLSGQERCITVCGVDVNGAALDNTITDNLQAYLESKREVNFIVSTIDPTITEIDVTVTFDVFPGIDPGSVMTAVTSALTAFLNPATWGGGDQQQPQWVPSSNVVRFLDVAAIIRNTAGVLYIPSGSLTIGIHGGAMVDDDVVLPGDAPLATTGTLSVLGS